MRVATAAATQHIADNLITREILLKEHARLIANGSNEEQILHPIEKQSQELTLYSFETAFHEESCAAKSEETG